MAKEYIEREELHKTILSAYITAERCGFELSKDVVLLAIKQQPAADVVEVRHSHWNEEGLSLVCADCGWMQYHDIPYGYCPNCGAKMDGGRDNV